MAPMSRSSTMSSRPTPRTPRADTVSTASGAAQGTDTRAPESHDSSIISEVTPSEMAGDFSETRVQDAAADEPARGAALPLIGDLQRGAAAAHAARLVGAGLLGLVLATVLALSAASRSGEQVGAIGQALMQSQRLAKSVSQALVGSCRRPSRKCKESVEVLAATCAAMGGGDENLPPAPAAVQDAVDPLLPLVDRAEKNAAIVLASRRR